MSAHPDWVKTFGPTEYLIWQIKYYNLKTLNEGEEGLSNYHVYGIAEQLAGCIRYQKQIRYPKLTIKFQWN